MDVLMRQRAVGRRLGVSAASVRRYWAKGHLPCIETPGGRKCSAAELDAWLRARTKGRGT